MTNKPINRPVFELHYDCGCRFFVQMIAPNSTICEVDQQGTHFSVCQTHHHHLWQEMVVGQYAFKRFKKRGSRKDDVAFD